MANIKYLCDFQFNSPYQGFDRNQVCGRICTLFRVKNVEHLDHMFASLETVKYFEFATDVLA